MPNSIEQQITQHLKNTREFLENSQQFNSQAISAEQRKYQEPFGIDKMDPEQWFLHIYLDYALICLQQKNMEFFKNIDGFSYFFEYTWGQQEHEDFATAISLIREYENLVKAFNSQNN
ncbi:hypothetical protein CKF54_03230 [Psittacicella hinzii]|uniref:YqcC-like domain-containing protein n=1 Tax=Psittacicella hinzii TaxID=2028575 RepID=A0A3A1Y7M6_9GAMM|nr:YqcC family protein [Psittacicella hinzii]RIY33218.1 hypothetical protein CKF54_03230 [Psittacicella hinzii]